jgi:5-(carboxyamino)imidazole ribonucleotide synthase
VTRRSEPLPFGATIGILGGGQLGRMSAHAAARLGYRTHVFTPEAGSPAGEVASAVTVAAFEDAVALRAFCASVDVLTFEFENIPPAVLDVLDTSGVPCRPGTEVLRIGQDRVLEKRFFEFLTTLEREHRLSLVDTLEYFKNPQGWLEAHERVRLDGG